MLKRTFARILFLTTLMVSACTSPSTITKVSQGASPSSTPTPEASPISLERPAPIQVGAGQPFEVTNDGGAWHLPDRALTLFAPRSAASYSAQVTLRLLPDEQGIENGTGFVVEATPGLPVRLQVEMPATASVVGAITSETLGVLTRGQDGWMQASGSFALSGPEGVIFQVPGPGTFGLGPVVPLVGGPTDMPTRADVMQFLYEFYAMNLSFKDPVVGWVTVTMNSHSGMSYPWTTQLNGFLVDWQMREKYGYPFLGGQQGLTARWRPGVLMAPFDDPITGETTVYIFTLGPKGRLRYQPGDYYSHHVYAIRPDGENGDTSLVPLEVFEF